MMDAAQLSPVTSVSLTFACGLSIRVRHPDLSPDPCFGVILRRWISYKQAEDRACVSPMALSTPKSYQVGSQDRTFVTLILQLLLSCTVTLSLHPTTSRKARLSPFSADYPVASAPCKPCRSSYRYHRHSMNGTCYEMCRVVLRYSEAQRGEV